MKTLKYLFAFALSFIALTTISSCSEEEASYSPAKAVAGAQVFFPSSNAASIDLAQDATSFDVTIARVDTASALNVPLTCTTTDTLGLFTLPASVDFAAGATTATITISYDAEEIINTIGYAAYNDIIFSLGEEYATPYGNGNYKVSVGIPEPWSAWELYATGTYTYSLFWAGDDTGRKVYYREYQLDKTIAQFKVEGVMYGIDLVIDYNTETGACKVAEHYTAYDHASYGAIFVSDLVNYAPNSFSYESAPCSFNKETGLFELNLIYYCSAGYFGYGVEEIQLDGFYIPDYSANVYYIGVYTNPSGDAFGVTKITKGVDAELVKVAYAAGSDDDALLDAVMNGEIEAQEYTTDSCYYQFPVDKTGKYTVVAISYVGDSVMEATSNVMEITVGKEPWTEWEFLTTATYTYTLFFTDENGGPITDEGRNVSFRESTEEEGKAQFIIDEVMYGISLVIDYDANTGACSVAEQYVGYDHPSYGPVYVADLVTYAPENFTQETAPSTFDEETGTFSLSLVYYCEAGIFAYTGKDGAAPETIQLDAPEAEEAPAKRVSARRIGTKEFGSKIMNNVFSVKQF